MNTTQERAEKILAFVRPRATWANEMVIWYLDYNAARIQAGKRAIAPKSYLSRIRRGTLSRHNSLNKNLHLLLGAGLIRQTPSARYKNAYVWKWQKWQPFECYPFVVKHEFE